MAQSWTEVFRKRAPPLVDLPNVATLHKDFRTQHEIAAPRRARGVLQCATRMDTQGISRSGARGAGMVPMMMRVAAVPESVGDRSSFLVDSQGAARLADAFQAPQTDPQRFARVSRVAVTCVRLDSGTDQTIARQRDWPRH